MKSAIEGPNCIDPQICRGNCCSIKIDVPKILAEEYIKRGYANRRDFVRSNIFTFQLRFNEKTGKCFLFDKEINGCSIHKSGIKPPQCWIYPTGFSNPNNYEISCKKSSGWKIINIAKAKEAEMLLQKYIFLCNIEAKKELRLIRERLGYKDSTVLSAEGLSLQMKKFCFLYSENCKHLVDNFLDCTIICEVVADKLIEFLIENLYPYIKEKGQDTYGDYPLFKLFAEKDLLF